MWKERGILQGFAVGKFHRKSGRPMSISIALNIAIRFKIKLIIMFSDINVKYNYNNYLSYYEPEKNRAKTED